MKELYQDLYQFSTYLSPIDLTFNQYLLSGDEPILIHTGDHRMAAALLPRLEKVLGGRKLKYVFGSHFEADEFGGLQLILERYPGAQVVCSKVSARQLSGFGWDLKILTKASSQRLSTDSYDLEFLSYPSEMHLWEGLLAQEHRRGIFFSADLMIRRGNLTGAVVDSIWQDEVAGIEHEQCPDPELRIRLQNTLAGMSPRFVATGHGPCLNLEV